MIKEVNEFMQNLRIPLVSAEISCEECAAAELIEFDALSDDQDIRPINDELVNEMFTHLVTNPYSRWRHDHSAPTMMVLMKRHQLYRTMRKVRHAIMGTNQRTIVRQNRPLKTSWVQSEAVLSSGSSEMVEGKVWLLCNPR